MLIQINMYITCGIGFDLRSKISLPGGSVGKNVTIFGCDMTPTVHIDNKN